MPCKKASKGPIVAPADRPRELDRLRELIELDPRLLREKAEAAEMSPSQLSHVKSGHRADPQFSTVVKILKGLGRKLADLDD